MARFQTKHRFSAFSLALTLGVAFATPGLATSQTPVIGIHLGSSHQLYSSDATDFGAQFTPAPNTLGRNVFAVDFDVTGTTLWGIDYDTSEYGTIDQTTGLFTALGPTPIPPGSAVAMTCQPNGSWFVYARAGNDMHMYGGDVTTGSVSSFNILFGHVLADIAYASEFQMFGISATDGFLYHIDTLFGNLTPILDLGAAPGFNHGLDFDWRDNTLWVSIETGTGTGKLLSIRGETDNLITTEITDTLGGAMSIAVQVPFLGYDTGTVFCDPMNANSTGQSTTLCGLFLEDTNTLHLQAIHGPSTNFAYMLVGTASADPGISIGNGQLCLSTFGNLIGRYNINGSTMNSLGSFTSAGRYEQFFGNSSIASGFDVPSTLPYDPTTVITTGQTLHFQLWHRDSNVGAGSNFSNGLSVTF